MGVSGQRHAPAALFTPEGEVGLVPKRAYLR
jgi:hypothetical protein